MKFTRIISLLLALLMLMGGVVTLVSCSEIEDGLVSLSRKVKDVDVSDYTLVYGDSQGENDYTNTFNTQMERFAGKLSDATGEKFSAYTIKRTKSTAADKEILVGRTTRTESENAYAKLQGEGFIIEVTENKIVILGSSNLYTLMAVSYFAERYLQNETPNKVLSVNESAKSFNRESVTLADSSKNMPADAQDVYTYMHRDKIATLPNAYAATDSSSANSTYKEYEQIAVDAICERVKEITGLGSKYIPAKTDKTNKDKEVLIGKTDRAESKSALGEIAGDEYIIKVTGTRVVVNSWSEATLKLAVSAYLDLMTEATEKGADGKVLVRIPQGFTLIGESKTEWVLDFPMPDGDGIYLYNTMDANDNALQFLYTGENVNATSYRAYCDTLKAAGYTVYMQNEVEGSIFSTFVNKEEKIALYVAYNAYAHKGDYAEYNWALSKTKTGDKDVYKYDPCFRIVSATLTDACLPPEATLQPQDYQKRTDSKVTTMPIYSKAVGLSYVVTLEDGSFIIFDGGGVNENGTEHDNLWSVLATLHEEIYGTAPTAQNPVHIAAWVLTHAHWDHYYAFRQLAKKYGSTGMFKMDYMIANVPAIDSAYTLRSIADDMTPELMKSLQALVKGSFQYIKVHTGQKFYIANLEIEVITTWEDLNPLVPNNTNDTNTVLRFTLSNQDAPGKKITQMWTGDANRWQSRFMCATFGDYLKSDMVSIAHHGNAGCEVEFYAMVSPTVVWWPHNAGSALNYMNTNKKNSDWRHQVDQYLCDDMASVKYIYTSGIKGGAAGSKEHFTTLVLTANGPDYDNIYDLLTGKKLSYDGFGSSCVKK